MNNKINPIVSKTNTKPKTPEPLPAPLIEITGTEGNDYLTGAYNFFGPSSDELIRGLGGNDHLNGLRGNDHLLGGAGNDFLNGGDGTENRFNLGDSRDAGNDYLDGGTGNDWMQGGLGTDTYVWGKGYGNDLITEQNFSAFTYEQANEYQPVTAAQIILGNTSNLQLVNLKPKDVQVSYDGGLDSQSFTLRIKSTGETLVWNGVGGLTDINIQFADGTQWDTQTLQNKFLQGTSGDDALIGFGGATNHLEGGAGRDTLVGGDREDLLLGGTGNDNISGGKGDDLIRGGAGFDVIDGGAGADSYQFGKGSGTDVLIGSQFGYYGNTPITNTNDSLVLDKGIRARDLNILQNGDSLVVQIKGTSDRFEIDGFFAPPSEKGAATVIDPSFNLVFADGTRWDGNTLAAKAKQDSTQQGKTFGASDGQLQLAGTQGNDTLLGNAGANTLYGRDGNDILDGKGGNDILVGGAGKDTFVFGKGSGQDFIADANNDLIKISSDLNPSDVYRFYEGDNLAIVISGSEEQRASGQEERIYIRNFMAQNLEANAEGTVIEFADGTRWTQKDLQAQRFMADDGDNTLTGTDGDDVIDGKGGADQINGGAGNDILHGGDQWDSIYGGTGNDQLYADGGDGSSLSGGDGNDLLVGGEGMDYLFGGLGNNAYVGGAGDDVMVGDKGNDRYEGGAGNDQINDFAGVNTLVLKGEFGQDTFAGLDSYNSSLILELEGKPADYQFVIGTDFGLSVQKGDNRLSFNTSAEVVLDALREVRFSDGTTWQGAGLSDALANHPQSANATSGNDMLTGDDQAQLLAGGGGNDRIQGGGGNDQLYGGDGDDEITGGAGNDYLFGGAGKDNLMGNGEYDRLYGGSGDDTLSANGILNGGAGNDTLITLDSARAIDAKPDLAFWDTLNGGAGNDELDGGFGNDSYIFETNFGQDTLYDPDSFNLYFSGGSASEYGLSLNDQGNLIVTQGQNSLTVMEDMRKNFNLQTLSFKDASLDAAGVRRALGLDPGLNPFADQVVQGTEGFDFLEGAIGKDTISGGASSDTLFGRPGDDLIMGGADGDSLFGETGDDHLIGGTGDDILDGGTGLNTYDFSQGDGNDTIQSEGGLNLVFQEGLAGTSLTATLESGELYLHFGQDQNIRFSGDPGDYLSRLNSLKIDGETYTGLAAADFINNKLATPITGLEQQAQLLVSAMAAFAPAAAAQLQLGNSAQDAVSVTLAVNAMA